MEFSIAVIIPIYNGSAFIEKALDSCWLQPEVKEVIVVNDGSTDNSIEILKQIAFRESRLKIHQHEGLINKGRSASRNLGIKNATQPYIAFLDADDYYLENRFKNDAEILLNNPGVDGVYNAIGVEFYRDYLEDEKKRLKLTTITEPVLYKDLFEILLKGKKGYFSIDGLTVKKDIFDKVGYFDENLEVAEDTDLILKMSLLCRLESGVLNEPLAIRGVHKDNVFNKEELYIHNRENMFESLIYWALTKSVHQNKVELLLKQLFNYRDKNNYSMNIELRYWFKFITKCKKLLWRKQGIKYFPLIRKRKQLFPIIFR